MHNCFHTGMFMFLLYHSSNRITLAGIRVHKSYLVMFEYRTDIEECTIVMSRYIEILISTMSKKSLKCKETFTKFFLGIRIYKRKWLINWTLQLNVISLIVILRFRTCIIPREEPLLKLKDFIAYRQVKGIIPSYYIIILVWYYVISSFVWIYIQVTIYKIYAITRKGKAIIIDADRLYQN